LRLAHSTAVRLCFGFILAFCASGRASGAAETARTPPVELTVMSGSVEVGLDLDLLEDANGNLSIDDVRSPLVASIFQRSSWRKPSFGITSSV